jgi:phenylacetate-CoA ligase
METGVLAHETTINNYQTMWHDFLIEALDNAETPGRYDIAVTSLYPRCFPLIRYHLGDQITLLSASPTVIQFSKVIGRCNDLLTLASGKVIHSEVIAHAVRDIDKIQGYQVVQFSDKRLQLRLQTRQLLDAEQRSRILERLSRVDVALQTMELNEVSQLDRSISGKTPTVLRHVV